MKVVFFLTILIFNLMGSSSEFEKLREELQEFTKRVKLLENENYKLKEKVGNLEKLQNEKEKEFVKRMELQELKDEINIIEEQDAESSEKLSKITEISGYADVEYKFTNKDGDNDGFRLHHLALFFKKQINDNWKFFSEIEYEDGAKIEANNMEGKIFVEALSLEYQLNQYLNLRFGRFLTPAGIWNVEHYPPFVTTQLRPLHIRKIFPQNSDGIGIYGTDIKNNILIDYSFYLGNGIDASGAGDINENKAVGGQVKFHFPILNETILGLSAYKDVDKSNIDINAYGVDLKVKYDNFTLQSEYAKGEYEDKSEKYGYYVQLIYDISNFSLVYRYDILKELKSKYKIDSFALNYHFTPYIVAKLEHHLKKIEDDNINDTILSISAYLSKW